MPFEPNDFQKKAMGLLISDPQASVDLQRHLRRIDPSIPLPNLPDVAFEERISQVIEPIKKELEETKAQLLSKKGVDMREYQWEQLRKMGWKDSQIQELEDRMNKDPDSNVYGSYVAAAKYYQQMDQPSLPNSGSRRDIAISGRPKGQEDWRKDFEEDGELRKLALGGDKTRRKRKAYAAQLASKARVEFRENYRGAR